MLSSSKIEEWTNISEQENENTNGFGIILTLDAFIFDVTSQKQQVLLLLGEKHSFMINLPFCMKIWAEENARKKVSISHEEMPIYNEYIYCPGGLFY